MERRIIIEGSEIRAASAVNIVGKITGNPKVFKKISFGTKIQVKKSKLNKV